MSSSGQPGPQRLLVDLACRSQRNGVDEEDVIRHPPIGDLSDEKVEMFLPVLFLSWMQPYDEKGAFIRLGMGNSDDSGGEGLRMTDRDVFDLDG